MAIFYTDSGSFNDVEVTGSVRISGSLNIAGGPLSASSYTSSVSNAVGFLGTSSWAVSASWAPGGGGVTISNNTNTYLVTATGIAATLEGEPNLSFDGTTLRTTGSLIVSSSGLAFQVSGSASIRDNLSVNGNTLFVDAGNSKVGIGLANPENTLQVQGNVSASTYTSSIINDVGFLGTSSRTVSASYADTFSGFINFPNGLIVTGSLIVSSSGIQLTGSQLFGTSSWAVTSSNSLTASFALNAGGGAGFPYSGSAVITGSLIVSSSGIRVIGNAITGSVFSGSLTAINEMSLSVSGTIAAPAGTTRTLDLNDHNFFGVSASGTGTVTWTLSNPPSTGRAQSFIIEYVNGGAVTNAWFTNTRWPGGTAPTLSTGASPDLLGFVTDDAGTNWRGVLLQRNSS